jgi:D-alanyl-D-alanine endopeptidase (penicillin-binding protein 7)
MTLNLLIAMLAAAAIRANPTPAAMPTDLYEAGSFPLASDAGSSGPVKPVKVREDSFGIETTAKSAIAVDVSSGAVLYAKEAEVERPIASLTKLAAAMVILDAGLTGEGTLTVQQDDLESIGRHWFSSGESLPKDEAFHAMLTQSVNELANAFARAYPGGTRAFVAAMNEKARTLGLERTSFADPTGISPRNTSSALDAARMFRSAIAYPEIREAAQSGAFEARTDQGRAVRLDPTNNLLSSYLNDDPYKIIAGKTGSLPEAGYCLGQVTRHPDGQQIITVVLGSENHFSRFQEVKALTAWAFDVFSWK